MKSSRVGSLHAGTNRLAHRNIRWVEVGEAKDVDAEIVGRHALAVKRIDAACLAEIVTCGQRALARQQAKPVFVHLDHERILAPANRAVAGGELRDVGLDFEGYGAAMA